MARKETDPPNIVGVRFCPTGRVHYFDAGDNSLTTGDQVIGHTSDGKREGEVVIAPNQVLHSELQNHLNKILEKLN